MGRYHVLSLIGKGSFGDVFLCKDLMSNSELRAVKRMTQAEDGHLGDGQTDLWRQEVLTLRGLSHPQLRRIYECFSWTKPPGFYMVMEWVEGRPLEEIISERPGKLTEQKVLAWALQIGEVLKYLHEQRPYPIIYGDEAGTSWWGSPGTSR